MLASWFRMKYPGSVDGAIACSAPILQFTGLVEPTVYSAINTATFRDVSDLCADSIADSWAVMEQLAQSTAGLQTIAGNVWWCGGMCICPLGVCLCVSLQDWCGVVRVCLFGGTLGVVRVLDVSTARGGNGERGVCCIQPWDHYDLVLVHCYGAVPSRVPRVDPPRSRTSIFPADNC